MLSSYLLLGKCRQHRERLEAREQDALADTRWLCFVDVALVGPDLAKCLCIVEVADFLTSKRGISTSELEYRPV